jgi:hypothetical protein
MKIILRGMNRRKPTCGKSPQPSLKKRGLKTTVHPNPCDISSPAFMPGTGTLKKREQNHFKPRERLPAK